MLAAKTTNCLNVKQAYDISPEEAKPYLSPLRDASEKELQAAETEWSKWLAMQDWILGPRQPLTKAQTRERIDHEAFGEVRSYIIS